MEINRVEDAAFRHSNGHNCAQAIGCAYSDSLNVDEQTMFQLTSGLGFGMGSMEGACGAINAAVMVAGMKAQQLGLNKGDAVRICSKMSKDFKEKNKTVICKEIKGIETGKILRSCHDCVIDAAEILDDAIIEMESIKE